MKTLYAQLTPQGTDAAKEILSIIAKAPEMLEDRYAIAPKGQIVVWLLLDQAQTGSKGTYVNINEMAESMGESPREMIALFQTLREDGDILYVPNKENDELIGCRDLIMEEIYRQQKLTGQERVAFNSTELAHRIGFDPEIVNSIVRAMIDEGLLSN